MVGLYKEHMSIPVYMIFISRQLCLKIKACLKVLDLLKEKNTQA